MVPVEIRHKGKKHSIKAAVSSCLMHPLILGMDWPRFNRLVGQWVGVRSQPTGTWDMCAVLTGDVKLPDTADGEGELAVPSQKALQVPAWHSVEDFPPEQSCDDTPHFSFDPLIKTDGRLLCPDAVQTYTDFSLVRDRLYRVNRNSLK